MPIFSAIAEATCDFESDFAIVFVCVVCLVVSFRFFQKSFDSARIKALHPTGASRKLKKIPEKQGDFRRLHPGQKPTSGLT
jgi:hypothetical protein